MYALISTITKVLDENNKSLRRCTKIAHNYSNRIVRPPPPGAPPPRLPANNTSNHSDNSQKKVSKNENIYSSASVPSSPIRHPLQHIKEPLPSSQSHQSIQPGLFNPAIIDNTQTNQFGCILLGRLDDDKSNDHDNSPILNGNGSRKTSPELTNNKQKQTTTHHTLSNKNKKPNTNSLSKDQSAVLARFVMTILSDLKPSNASQNNTNALQIPTNSGNNKKRKSSVGSKSVGSNQSVSSSESDHLQTQNVPHKKENANATSTENDNKSTPISTNPIGNGTTTKPLLEGNATDNNAIDNEQHGSDGIGSNEVADILSQLSPEPAFMEGIHSQKFASLNISNLEKHNNSAVTTGNQLPSPNTNGKKYKNNKNNNNNKQNRSQTRKEKEKLLIMASVTKFVTYSNELNTIDKACFNLWKNWYRCVSTIQNQVHRHFMSVCEKLLGNVQTQQLHRKDPSLSNENVSYHEKLTYELSLEILSLKHAFAIQQLQNGQKKKRGQNGQKKDAKNVSQIIDEMESKTWLIVHYIICEYFKSQYWVECRYVLFTLFLNEYEKGQSKLDRKFISRSTFGLYTLVCQLSNVVSKLGDSKEDNSMMTKSAELRAIKHTESSIDDGFVLDKSSSITFVLSPNIQSIKNKPAITRSRSATDSTVIYTTELGEIGGTVNTNSASTENKENTSNESSLNDNMEFKNDQYTNAQLLSALDWSFAVHRLHILLGNKRQDRLTHEHYKLLKDTIAPLFDCFIDHNKAFASLIRTIVGDVDYAALQSKYEQMVSKPTTNTDSWMILMNKISCSCFKWLTKDVFANYKTSEFCLRFAQLLSEPERFKKKNADPRSEKARKLHIRFNLTEDQTLSDAFTCALDSGRFLHHGTIYFFKDYVCFYSSMLGLKGAQQKILLPVAEFKTISKQITAWVFHNAIKIEMKDGRCYTFRSFLNRDPTIDLLQKIIDHKFDWEALAIKQQKEEQEERERKERKLQERKEREKRDRERKLREEKERENQGGNVYSSANLSKTGKKLMDDIPKLAIGHFQTALSTLNISPEKVLGVQPLASLNKPNGIHTKISISKSQSMSVLEMNSMAPVEMSSMSKNMKTYSADVPTQNGNPNIPKEQSRSAPPSPNKDNNDGGGDGDSKGNDDADDGSDDESKHSLGGIDDSDDDDTEDDDDDDDDDKEDDEKEITVNKGNGGSNEEKDPSADRSQPKAKVAVKSKPVEPELTKEELQAKAGKMNGMKCSYKLKGKVNTKLEKEFETIAKHEFQIGLTQFWDTFFGVNALYSTLDYMTDNRLNSNITMTEFKKYNHSDDSENEWFIRNSKCTTILEDMPSWFPSSISKCRNEQSEKYTIINPNYIIVHRILRVLDIPFADSYNIHQKFEFRQNSKVVTDPNTGKPTLSLTIDFTANCALEWTKSVFFKGPVKSRTILGIKAEAEHFCKTMDAKIDILLADQEEDDVEEEQKTSVSSMPTNSKKSKKQKKIKKSKSKSGLLRKSRSKSLLKSSKNEKAKEIKDEKEGVSGGGGASDDDDYDFVLKIGSNDSMLRFRMLFSIFTKSKNASSNKDGGNSGGHGMWYYLFMIVVGMIFVLCFYYWIAFLIGYISSITSIMSSSAQYLHQMNHINLMNQQRLQMQQNQYMKCDENDEYCKYFDLNNNIEFNAKSEDILEKSKEEDGENRVVLNDHECNGLLDSIFKNPSISILNDLYKKLECDESKLLLHEKQIPNQHNVDI